MLTIDPIVALDPDPIRLPDATYRQHQRRRLLVEIELSDDKQLELDGTMIARNDVIETFKLPLSVALHNADVVDNSPVQVLELAFRVASKCEVAGF